MPTLATLYVFPHAGGSPSYYVPLAAAFGPDVRVVGVPYPGRGGAHDVAGLTGIEALADAVSARLSPATAAEGPIAFFGHSMGALVAFETACRFESAGRAVDGLFVSACAAPGESGFDVAADDAELLDAAARMTGADPALLRSEEFSARILPTLRGFQAITAYRPDAARRVTSAIRAYSGETDEIATAERMSGWAARTSGYLGLRSFPGHHFYLGDHAGDVAADIEATLRRGAAARPV
ncbi:alpha/beta fold hydrolase [Tsukamurella sp. 8F]|uniref:thioesterase II family protein n=1 Tax=unclassified Tsukamurella TaxID=2633480 RepID=UPI0023B94E69|nr:MULTISPECIES: alpha/beta fold hydrolase [unclassified Tsukamurella]MDF0529303.1 alpha/beta fold hydrolase [Tsukamurella sp. 8J]MDF0586860.1 alpha/beta fold hydrolase [Tsukamurella sp. 8F]